ncbi:MAG: N-acetylmuramoyl-L-alanine amidase-like domain-containing protein [Bacteroidota bacterium]
MLSSVDEADLGGKEVADQLITIGKFFLGTPYQAHTLEIADDEPLVVHLQGLDCTTYLENVVAFYLLQKEENRNWEAFARTLSRLRYRDAVRKGYATRLHYFTEWIYNNQQKGILQDITQNIGGVPYDKPLDFITTHRDSYRQLHNEAYFEEMKKVEAAFNAEKKLYMVPEEQLREKEALIKDGDILAITTTIKGLDVVHTGLAIHVNDRLHLLHASSLSCQVEVSEKPLLDMLLASKSRNGIIVGRVIP